MGPFYQPKNSFGSLIMLSLSKLDVEVALKKRIPKWHIPAFFFSWTIYRVTKSKNTFPTVPKTAMTRNVYSSPILMYSSENVQSLRSSVEDSVVELELELIKSVSILNFELLQLKLLNSCQNKHT